MRMIVKEIDQPIMDVIQFRDPIYVVPFKTRTDTQIYLNFLSS